MPDLVIPAENWLPVVGWEGLYDVSDWGRVRSLDRVIITTAGGKPAHPRRYPGRVLKPTLNADGYPVVGLARSGYTHLQRVHRLVLEVFAGRCPEGMEALHGPGGRADASLANLRWGTHVENEDDKLRDGTKNIGERHGLSKLTEAIVSECRRRYAGGESGAALAREFGVSQPVMSRAIRGTGWREAEALPVTHGTAPGAVHGMAKLTLADVAEIRRRLAAGELQRMIAADYGVQRQSISKIATGIRWRDL